jgi:hypothetical protein
VSDPLPTILEGIPLQVRDVRVTLDRPGFMFNPTDCSEQAITGTVGAVTGRSADVSDRYQVGECEALGYSPKLALALTGKGQSSSGKHPGLTAHLATKKGQANTQKAKVALPLSLALDPNNAQGLCKPEQRAARNCPASSIVGQAKVNSILHEPLEAPVYFVEGRRTDSKGKVHKTLPDLWLPLSGEGVTIDVTAKSDVAAQKLVTTFDNLPDAPFTSFDLTITGGKHGILVVTGDKASVCRKRQVANAAFDGQNGKVSDSAVAVSTKGACRGAKKKRTRR